MSTIVDDLLAGKNGKMRVEVRTPNVGGAGLMAQRSSVTLSRNGSALRLAEGNGGSHGMWVHYYPTRANYGLASAGETWAASGPFSGCHLVLGKKDGRVYVAHLAQESGSEANEDWAKRRNEGGWADDIWGRWKVPLPNVDYHASSIVFVDWSAGPTPSQVKVVRVDVKTKAMGGFDQEPMEIVNVERQA